MLKIKKTHSFLNGSTLQCFKKGLNVKLIGFYLYLRYNFQNVFEMNSKMFLRENYFILVLYFTLSKIGQYHSWLKKTKTIVGPNREGSPKSKFV